jgi:uncharacterized membrane protein
VTRREIFFIAGITLLGAALRLFQLGAQSLWLDELFSVFVSRRDWGDIIAGTTQDTMPPLYYFILHLALQFGSDEVAARFVSFLFGVTVLALFYALARQLFDARVAWIAGSILAINPLAIFYSQEARMYTQLVFFVCAALIFFNAAWRNNSARNWGVFGLMMTLAFYTHSLAFLNLLALDVFALTQIRQLCQRWRALVLAHVVILVLYSPWLLVSIQQASRVQTGFWVGLPSPAAIITTTYLFLFSDALPSNALPLALFIALAVIALGVLASVRTIRIRGKDAASMIFAWCVFLVPLIALYLLSFLRSIYVERAILPASLGLYLVLAWMMARVQPRALNLGLGIALIALMLLALPIYYFDPASHKPPMRDAANALARQFQNGDAIVHTSDSSALAFMYYQPNLPNAFMAGDPDYVSETTRGQSGRIAGLVPKDYHEIVAHSPRVWLVVALDHNVEYQTARVAEFDARWKRADSGSVGGIWLYSYVLESNLNHSIGK